MNTNAYNRRQVHLGDLAYITLHRAGINTSEEATGDHHLLMLD